MKKTIILTALVSLAIPLRAQNDYNESVSTQEGSDEEEITIEL